MLKKESLFIPFSILLVFSTTQLALVSRMVAFLHTQKVDIGSYYVCESINTTGQNQDENLNFDLYVLPEKISLNQGHTTNGAAGYGLILSIACLAGTFVLRNNKYYRHHKTILRGMTIALGLLVLFTFSAFIYVFAVTYLTIGNKIDIQLARNLAGKPYNIDSWTPETWYQALLSLPLYKADLSSAYEEMVTWRWWILPYLFVCLTAFAWTATVYVKERELPMDFMRYWGEKVSMDRKSSPV